MSRSRFSLTLESILALSILAFIPSSALASDFGLMVDDFLLMIAMLGGLALVLGVITWAVLFRAARQQWGFIPIFAVCWIAVILGGLKLWGWYDYRSRPREPGLPVPARYLSPEGISHGDEQPQQEW